MPKVYINILASSPTTKKTLTGRQKKSTHNENSDFYEMTEKLCKIKMNVAYIGKACMTITKRILSKNIFAHGKTNQT